MRFTNAFSVVAAFVLFATANAAVVQDELTGRSIASSKSVYELEETIQLPSPASRLRRTRYTALFMLGK